MSDDFASQLLDESSRGVSIDELIRRIEEVDGKAELPKKLTEPEAEAEPESEATIFQLLQSMSVPQKIKLALQGNKVARMLLVRDTSKQVPLFVLQNPGITEEEILEIARSTEVSELVFRAIVRNGAWMKSYPIKLQLVSNPRVPIDISMQWVKHLRDRDLRRLMKSKNIPNAVATQCRKLVEKRLKK